VVCIVGPSGHSLVVPAGLSPRVLVVLAPQRGGKLLAVGPHSGKAAIAAVVDEHLPKGLALSLG
jgi:hypothetical protein